MRIYFKTKTKIPKFFHRKFCFVQRKCFFFLHFLNRCWWVRLCSLLIYLQFFRSVSVLFVPVIRKHFLHFCYQTAVASSCKYSGTYWWSVHRYKAIFVVNAPCMFVINDKNEWFVFIFKMMSFRRIWRNNYKMRSPISCCLMLISKSVKTKQINETSLYE